MGESGFLNRVTFELHAKRLTPFAFVLVGFLFWLVIRASSSYLYYSTTLQDSAFFFIGVYLLAFFAGTALAPKFDGARSRFTLDPTDPRDIKTIQTTALILAGLCFLFVSLRIYDLIANRSLLEFANAQAARIADNTVIEGRTTGGIGLISGIGYPIAIPAIVFGILYKEALQKWQLWTVIGSFGYYGFFVLMSGSRYILIGPLFLVLVALIMAEGVLKIRMKHVLVTLTFLVIGFIFITTGTRTRDALFGTTSALETMIVMPNRLQYGAEPEFIDWMAEQPPVVQEAILGWSSFAWYVNHGLYEFQNVLDFADPSLQSGGTAQFSRAFYFFRVLGLTDMDDDLWIVQIKNNGFYTSFFGPVYFDFKLWGGILYMAIVGLVFQATWQGVRGANVACAMIYPYFASVLFSFPTNNLIMAGLGVPIMANIFGCIIICALVRRWHWSRDAKPLVPGGASSGI